MITLKIKIQNEYDVESYISCYSKLKRISYNCLKDGKSLIETQKYIKSSIDHILDASFVEYASLDAQQIKKSSEKLDVFKIIFGGKSNFKKLNKKSITKDQWREFRNPYIYAIGRSNEKYGNRKFKIDFIKNKCFYFCPNKKTKIKLDVNVSQNQTNLLNKIEEFSRNFKLAITYKLTRSHLLLTIDETIFSKQSYVPISDRILSIDLNPNSIGIVISDFKDSQKVIFKQIFYLKKLNEESRNKKLYENFQIIKSIIKLCDCYKVESIGVEKLNIPPKDNKKGKKYNKTVNNDWIRTRFINNLKKHCNLNNVRIYEIIPNYSSFIGCINNQNEIDSIAAAIEIGRRTYLFSNVFTKNNLPRDTKIVFPEWNFDSTNPWKKELGKIKISSWKQFYSWFHKNPKLSYRTFLSEETSRFFRFLHRKSNVFLCKG